MTTAELIREIQTAKLYDPLRAAILELELGHRTSAMDGSTRAKLLQQRDSVSTEGLEALR